MGFLKITQPLDRSATMSEQKTVFFTSEKMWKAGCDWKVSSAPPHPTLCLSATTTCSSQQPSFVIFTSHKSLKIAVVNDRPTHFLLNTPPSRPLPKTKMLSSLALTSILFRTYPVIIEAEKKELPLSLFRSFNFDGPQIYGVRIPVFGCAGHPALLIGSSSVVVCAMNSGVWRACWRLMEAGRSHFRSYYISLQRGLAVTTHHEVNSTTTCLGSAAVDWLMLPQCWPKLLGDPKLHFCHYLCIL